MWAFLSRTIFSNTILNTHAHSQISKIARFPDESSDEC